MTPHSKRDRVNRRCSSALQDTLTRIVQVSRLCFSLCFAGTAAGIAFPVQALEPPALLRESAGMDAGSSFSSCSLQPNLTGSCANLRYYNICSGYIWAFDIGDSQAVGTLFDGPCIQPGSSLTRVITYYRNAVPAYSSGLEIHIDLDANSDGCPDSSILTFQDVDVATRWNCIDLGPLCVPAGASGVIVRQVSAYNTPRFVTDAGLAGSCNAIGSPHSFYYGKRAAECVPWRFNSPNGRDDNFLTWLIVDVGCETAAAPTTWGNIKSLFQ